MESRLEETRLKVLPQLHNETLTHILIHNSGGFGVSERLTTDSRGPSQTTEDDVAIKRTKRVPALHRSEARTTAFRVRKQAKRL